MSGMLASLGDNQMFGAGFGLFSVGVAATVAKKGMQVKYAFLVLTLLNILLNYLFRLAWSGLDDIT